MLGYVHRLFIVIKYGAVVESNRGWAGFAYVLVGIFALSKSFKQIGELQQRARSAESSLREKEAIVESLTYKSDALSQKLRC